MDIWFAKNGTQIWFIWTVPGEEPRVLPVKAPSVAAAFKAMREAGVEIGQVGITDKHMIGLS